MEFDIYYPIHLNETEMSKHSNALRTARVLAVGLAQLFRSVQEAEALAMSRCADANGPDVREFAFGNLPELSDVPMDLVECTFRWYAVTACDFVRMATWIAQFDDDARKAYADDVLGALQAFRDKVGAHTAGATQNRRDNIAEQKMSSICQISWCGDRFEAAMLTLSVQQATKLFDSSALRAWSLTEFHLKLCQRYPLVAQLSGIHGGSSQPS